MLKKKNKSFINFISNNKNSYFFNLIISYAVIILIAIFIVASTTYNSFYSAYTKELDKLNQNILQYLITIINNDLIDPLNQIYADVVFEQEEKYLRTFIESSPNQLEINKIYQILVNYATENNDIISAVHLYSFKTGIIISSQYGYKTQENTSINRDFIRTDNSNRKEPYWVPTRNTSSASAFSSSNVLTKVFYIGSPTDQALLAVDIDERLLYNYIEKLLIDNESDILIVDKNMNILTHKNKSILGSKIPENYQKPLLLNKNSTSDIKDGRKKLILSHAGISSTDWQIVLISDVNSFYPALGKITITLFFALLIATVIAFSVALIYSKKLSSPIKRLVYMFKRNNNEPLDAIVSNIFNHVSELNMFVEENKDVLKNNFIICSYYNSFASEDDLNVRSSVLLRNFPAEFYAPCVIELGNLPKSDLLIYFKIVNILKENILPFKIISSEIGGNRIALIIAYEEKEQYQKTADGILSVMKDFESYITVYMGELTEDITNIPNGFFAVQKMYEYKFFYPKLHFIYHGDIKEKLFADDTDTTLPVFDIDFAMKAGYKEYTENFISNLIFGKYSVSQANQAILNALHNVIAVSKERRIPLAECKDYFQNKSFSDIYQVQETLLKICGIYSKNLQLTLENKNYLLIENIKSFIADNLSNDISLTTIAEHTHITTTHLSKIFKSETGMNLSNYIKDVKLLRAKDYLLTTNLTINEISEKLSYNTPHYFIKLFKEKYGVTPKNFRQTNGV